MLKDASKRRRMLPGNLLREKPKTEEKTTEGE